RMLIRHLAFASVVVVVVAHVRAAELDAVFADWEKLRSKFTRVKYVAEGETTDVQGMYNEYAVDYVAAGKAPRGDIPPRDYRFRARRVYVLDFESKLARTEYLRHEFSFDTFTHVPRYRIVLFDGNEVQQYFPRQQNTFPDYVPDRFDRELEFMSQSF